MVDNQGSTNSNQPQNDDVSVVAKQLATAAPGSMTLHLLTFAIGSVFGFAAHHIGDLIAIVKAAMEVVK